MNDMVRKSPWQWALVTGASAGIGQEFAEVLASQGTNLVLVARDRERLSNQAKTYRDRFGVKVDVLAVNLMDPKSRLQVEERLRSTKDAIDLLLNNAGLGTVGKFNELPVDGEEREIDLNVIALVRLTHAALGQMISRKTGNIMNISSISGLMPGPRMATYAATKAYVTSFTESLSRELKGTGVSITAVHPGYTKTEFQERAGMQNMVADVPSFMWMSANTVAKQSLVAAKRGKVFFSPGAYSLITSVINVLPRSIKRSMAN